MDPLVMLLILGAVALALVLSALGAMYLSTRPAGHVTGSQNGAPVPLRRRLHAVGANRPDEILDRLGIEPWPEYDVAAETDAQIAELIHDDPDHHGAAS